MNHKKLLNSKWTAKNPINKEKHFIVIKVNVNNNEQKIDSIILQSVLTRREYLKTYIEFKNEDDWITGWV